MRHRQLTKDIILTISIILLMTIFIGGIVLKNDSTYSLNTSMFSVNYLLAIADAFMFTGPLGLIVLAIVYYCNE